MSEKMTDTDTFPAWITKYALTTGIEEIIAEQTGRKGTIIADKSIHFYYYYGEGIEWHRTREGAVIRAEEMRAEQIASLQKSIADLEKVSFK